MKQGERVRFTAQLGLTERVNATKFVGQVEPGDEGIYVGPLPEVKGMKDWHLIAVHQPSSDPLAEFADELYCPCHISQFQRLITD